MSENKTSYKKIAIGAGIGAALGVITGVLIAPKSGKETREDLKKATKLSISKAEKQLKKAHAEIGDLLNNSQEKAKKLSGDAKVKFGEAIDTAKKTKKSLADIISALRSGEATDEELKQALSSAKTAKDHLKAFLKKA